MWKCKICEEEKAQAMQKIVLSFNFEIVGYLANIVGQQDPELIAQMLDDIARISKALSERVREFV